MEDRASFETAVEPLLRPLHAHCYRFVGVQDVPEALAAAERLGGRVVQPATSVPGVTFGLFADPQGQVVGVAASG